MLEQTIENAAINALERMKIASKDDRYHLMLEFGEWIFNEYDSDDELIVPDLGALEVDSK